MSNGFAKLDSGIVNSSIWVQPHDVLRVWIWFLSQADSKGVVRTAAPPLAAGECWAEDLEGCAVVTAGGRSLGIVGGLRALPSCEVLEVGDLLVPMCGDAMRVVDIAARRIVVDAAFLGVGDAEPPVASDRPQG